MKKLVYFCLCASLSFTCPMYSIEATTYEYDELGRVTQATNEDGSLVTYVYDANGNLVEIKTEVGEKQTEMSGSDEGSGEETTEGMQNSIGTANNAIGEDAIVVSESAEHATNADGVSDNTAKDDIAEDNTTGTDTTDEDIIADIEAKLEGQSEDKNDGFGIPGGIVTGAAVAVAGSALFLFLMKRKKKNDAKEGEES